MNQHNMMQSANEGGNDKELLSQLKAAQDALKHQTLVNKNLAGKSLLFEKQIADERKRRQDLERILASSNSQSTVSNQGSDLSAIQKQMSDLKSRMNNMQ